MSKKAESTPTIRFESKLLKIHSWTLLLLPKSASDKLPSRGQTMVEGTINGAPFKAALEPDGKASHWFRVDKTLLQAAHADVGDTVKLEIKSTQVWPEPEVPVDLQSALDADAKAKELWLAIKPVARWDWIRWIGSTKNADTRKKRIEVSFSKLKSGEKRPCCFNRTLCCEPQVSHNGVLFAPTE